jgi:hypothetical protein
MRNLILTVATTATAISSTAPTAITSAALTPPSAAASALSTTASAATSTASTFLRTRFIHYQGASQKIFSIQCFDRLHRVRIVCNFREAEAARLIRKAVAQQRKLIGLHSDLREHRRNLFFGSFERQIAEIQFLHCPFSLGARTPIEKLKKQDFGRGRPSGDGPHPV